MHPLQKKKEPDKSGSQTVDKLFLESSDAKK